MTRPPTVEELLAAARKERLKTGTFKREYPKLRSRCRECNRLITVREAVRGDTCESCLYG